MPDPSSRYEVLDSMGQAAKAHGWHNVGASTSEHWVALTVTDGLAGLPRDHMYRVSSPNVSAHMTLEQIANWLTDHPDEPVEINYPTDQGAGLRATISKLEKLDDQGRPRADSNSNNELLSAATGVVSAYDSSMSMVGDWADRLENAVAILREVLTG